MRLVCPRTQFVMSGDDDDDDSARYSVTAAMQLLSLARRATSSLETKNSSSTEI